MAHASGWLNPNFAYGQSTVPNAAVNDARDAADSSPVTFRLRLKISQMIHAPMSDCPSATAAFGILSGLPAVTPVTLDEDGAGDVERDVVDRLQDAERRVVAAVRAAKRLEAEQVARRGERALFDDVARDVERDDRVGRRQAATGREEVDAERQSKQPSTGFGASRRVVLEADSHLSCAITRPTMPTGGTARGIGSTHMSKSPCGYGEIASMPFECELVL